MNVNSTTSTRSRMVARVGLAVAAFALSAFPSPAHAGPGEAAAAQALFDQGKKLMAQGHFAEGCVKLEESERIESALGTMLNLADCYEKAGMLASAWSKFAGVEGLARASNRSKVEQVAHDRTARLAPRVSQLIIKVATEAPPGLEVRRDGVLVGRPQWDIPIPSDGGLHTVVATAPGYGRWEKTVTLAPASDTQTVQIATLARETSRALPPGAAVSEAPAPLSPAPEPPDSTARGGFGARQAFALTAGGLGLAGIALGTAYGLKSKAKRDEAATVCNGSQCSTTRGVELKDAAKSAGNIATLAFAVGGVGLAGGAILWLTGGANDHASSVGWRVSVGPAAVTLDSSW